MLSRVVGQTLAALGLLVVAEALCAFLSVAKDAVVVLSAAGIAGPEPREELSLGHCESKGKRFVVVVVGGDVGALEAFAFLFVDVLNRDAVGPAALTSHELAQALRHSEFSIQCAAVLTLDFCFALFS